MSEPNIQWPSIVEIKVDDKFLTAKLSDGRVVSAPKEWFKRLQLASTQQLKNFELSPSGHGVHWPEIDEDISVRALLAP